MNEGLLQLPGCHCESIDLPSTWLDQTSGSRTNQPASNPNLLHSGDTLQAEREILKHTCHGMHPAAWAPAALNTKKWKYYHGVIGKVINRSIPYQIRQYTVLTSRVRGVCLDKLLFKGRAHAVSLARPPSFTHPHPTPPSWWSDQKQNVITMTVLLKWRWKEAREHYLALFCLDSITHNTLPSFAFIPNISTFLPCLPACIILLQTVLFLLNVF